tara:strand:+ start:52 stop:744 length:693 start_codon:yes stop_codon:yes gene_type:complete
MLLKESDIRRMMRYADIEPLTNSFLGEGEGFIPDKEEIDEEQEEELEEVAKMTDSEGIANTGKLKAVNEMPMPPGGEEDPMAADAGEEAPPEDMDMDMADEEGEMAPEAEVSEETVASIMQAIGSAVADVTGVPVSVEGGAEAAGEEMPGEEMPGEEMPPAEMAPEAGEDEEEMMEKQTPEELEEQLVQKVTKRVSQRLKNMVAENRRVGRVTKRVSERILKKVKNKDFK